MRRRLSLLVLFLVAGTAWADENAVPETWRVWVAEHDAMPASHYRQPEDAELRELLADATHEQVSAAAADPDSEVRALAAMAAGWSDEPTLLPLLRPLLDDLSETLAHRWIPAGQPGGLERLHVVEEAQTVSDVASRVIGQWLQGRRPAIDAFLDQVSTEKGAHSSVAIWHRRFRVVPRGPTVMPFVELRPGGIVTGTYLSHPSEQEIAGKAAVRARMQREAPPLIYAAALLSAPRFGEPVASSDHLRRLVNDGLKREHVFAILRGEPPFEDSYLRPRGPGPYRRLCRTLLRYRAFGVADVEDLTALLSEDPDTELYGVELFLALARASTSTDEAQAALELGLERLDSRVFAHQRGILIGEGWASLGARRTEWWCAQVLGADVPEDTVESAIGRVLSSGGPAAREFAGVLVRHQRFDGLSWSALAVVAHGVNALAGANVLGEDELRVASHPLGRLDTRELAAAMKTHPEATRELEETLAGWRKTLRAYVDQAEW